MGNFFQTIVKFIQSLFGGGTSQPPDDEFNCAVFNLELPAVVEPASLPFYPATKFTGDIVGVSAQAIHISCTIQIRPSVGRVNVRGGPRLEFGAIAQTEGGALFELQGASEADGDGFRWYTIKTKDGTGWIRGDMVIIGEDCLAFTFIDEDDLIPPELPYPIPTARFPLPSSAKLTQNYTSSHRAFDLLTDYGTPIIASAPGLIIRKTDCIGCDDNPRPNYYPCPGWVLRSEEWGYGYGNVVTIRHNYESMPPTMREHMDRNNLTGGFVYILYAHLSENHVELGDFVLAGAPLGLTGNHGCSSAPHLHFEIRMGRDETVDGVWLQQKSVHPDLIFET